MAGKRIHQVCQVRTKKCYIAVPGADILGGAVIVGGAVLVNKLVILSGVAASRSEAATQPKDLYSSQN
jgi:hypothetical protein